jgi:hypothetical protein
VSILKRFFIAAPSLVPDAEGIGSFRLLPADHLALTIEKFAAKCASLAGIAA